MKVIILILIFIGCFVQTQAQFIDAASVKDELWKPRYGVNKWDNTLEMCLQNAQIVGEYFEVDVILNKVGLWYFMRAGATTVPARKTNELNQFTLTFNYNATVLSTDPNDVEFIVNTAMWPTDLGYDGITFSGALFNMTSVGERFYKIEGGSLYNGCIQEDGEMGFNTGEGVLFGKFRWKIQPGAAGRTGFVGRPYQDRGSSGIHNSQNGGIIIVPTGNGDIEVGENTPATIVSITGDAAGCDGAKSLYTVTTEGNVTSIDWYVSSDAAGNTPVSGVADFEVGNDLKSKNITWHLPAGSTSPITYYVCAKANGTGDAKTYAVTVNPLPTLKITPTNGKVDLCVGNTTTLTATPGLSSYSWKKGGVDLGIAVNHYAVTCTSAGEETYQVTAGDGTCYNSADITLHIGSGPTLSVDLKGVTNGVYCKGYTLKATASATGGSGNYTYEWLSPTAKEGNSYVVEGATSDSYKFEAKVTDTETGCAGTNSVTANANSNGCALTVDLAASGKDNTICVNGLKTLRASTTTTDPVVAYIWYKNGVKIDSIQTNSKKDSLIIDSDGTYTVKLRTATGIAEATINITTGMYTATKVIAEKGLSVAYEGSTVLVAKPETVNKALNYVWSPADKISSVGKGNAQQYPTTTLLYSDTWFYVHATDGSGCESRDSTKVTVGDGGLQVLINPQDPQICKGGSVTLHAHVSGGTGAYAYDWIATGETTPDIIFRDPDGSITFEEEMVVVVTSGDKKGVAKTVIKGLDTYSPLLSILGDNEFCEGGQLKVKQTNPGDVAPEGYVWYVRDNNTGTITKQEKTDDLTLTLGEMGSYRVWASIKAGSGVNQCYSDTTSVYKDITVNGVDLAWTVKPAGYPKGGTIKAEVKASKGQEPYSFVWKSPAGGAQEAGATADANKYSLEAASEGNYTFNAVVTDNRGCKDSLKETVNWNNSGLIIQVLTDKEVKLCKGGSALMQVAISGGSSPYTARWYKAGASETTLFSEKLQSTPATTQFVSGDLEDGDKIVVEVKDGSNPLLTRRDTMTIKHSDTENAPVIDAGDDMMIAYNSQTYLFGSVISGTPTSWHWTGKISGSADVQYPLTEKLLKKNTFKVYAIDGNKCVSALDSVTISVYDDDISYKFAVDINAPGTMCLGNKTYLSVTPTPNNRAMTEYAWVATANTLSAATDASPLLTVSAAKTTDVYVRVKDDKGVWATSKKSITVNNQNAPNLQLNGTSPLCSGTELTVSANPAVTLASSKWFVDGALVAEGNALSYSPTVTESKNIVIRVIATDINNCQGVDTVEKTFMMNPLPVLAWSDAFQDRVNPGDPVGAKAVVTTETTTGNYQWHWSHTGDVSGNTYSDVQDTSYLSSGTALATQSPYHFQVYVTDGNNCDSPKLDTMVQVNADRLTVTIAAKYGNFCTGGAAVLIANATGAAANTITYHWYNKNDESTELAAGKEFVIANPTAGDQYFVVATSTEIGTETGTPKEGDNKNSPYTLQSMTGKNAPQIEAIDETIAKGTKTALYAELTSVTTAPYSWAWTPESKLQANESTLRAPYTQELQTNEKFAVYAVDADKCVSNIDTAYITVKDVPATDPSVLAVTIDPTPVTICVTNQIELESTVTGGGASAPEYTWIEEHGYVSPVNEANTIFNDNKSQIAAGKYTCVLKVKKNGLTAIARGDIEIKTGSIPTIDWAQDTSSCVGGQLKIKVTNGVDLLANQYTWYINDVKVADVTGNEFVWAPEYADQTVNIKVNAVGNNGCRLDTLLSKDFNVKSSLQLNSIVKRDSCGQAVIVADGGQGTYKWNAPNGWSLSMLGQGDTVCVRPVAALTASHEDITVHVSVTPESGGCAAEADVNARVYFQPTVEMEKPYVVAAAGQEEVTINTTAKNDANFGPYTSYKWTLGPNNDPKNLTGDLVTRIQITAPLTKDDFAAIKVWNKEKENLCAAFDTCIVYLLPEPPTLTIDTTEGSLTKIALKLDGGTGDNYTIWSRKWDPYCLTSEDGGEYHKEVNADAITAKLWREPNMDTLEFYYATSGRVIDGTTYNSKATSDTVGYYLYDLHVNSEAGQTSFNMVAVYFDFEKMGYPTTEELFKNNLKTDVSYIRKWRYEQQDWYYSRMIIIGPNQNVAQAFAIEQGMLLNFQPAKEMQLLQYGKLPSRFSISYSYTTTTPKELTFMLPQRLDMKNVSDIFSSQSKLVYIRKWNFSTQQWDYARKMGAAVIGSAGNFDLISLMGLQFQLGAASTEVWE